MFSGSGWDDGILGFMLLLMVLSIFLVPLAVLMSYVSVLIKIIRWGRGGWPTIMSEQLKDIAWLIPSVLLAVGGTLLIGMNI